MAQGHLAHAQEAYEKGLEAASRTDYRRIVQLANDSLGTIALLEGRIDDSHSYFLKSLKITFENGQFREQLGSLRDIASVYQQKGNWEAAVELLAVVLHHPAKEQNSLSRRESLQTEAERLLAEIEATLPAERFRSAWQRGKRGELGKVVAGLLNQNRDPVACEPTVAFST